MRNNNILAFIPARAGSKRLPNKNIKNFAGKPLVAWTIEAALAADLDMDVMVSTDSLAIANIAKNYGAEVPFMRPEELAADDTSMFDSLKDAILKLAKIGRNYKYIMLLQPTSPLRQSLHIEEAFNKLIKTSAESVVAVSKIDHPVEWSIKLPENGDMSNYIQTNLKYLKVRSQDLPARHIVNGAIFCGKIESVLEFKTFYLKSGTYSYEMERRFSIDIDDINDFEYAKFLMLKNLEVT